MIKLGKTIRFLREAHGQSQIEASRLLGVSNVHLCNLENQKAYPSPDLLARVKSVWGVDLYVLAWCIDGDASSLPTGVRQAAVSLTNALKQQLEGKGIKFNVAKKNRNQEQEYPRKPARVSRK
jgi:transcriptional regulator with XRE-family HTH domain